MAFCSTAQSYTAHLIISSPTVATMDYVGSTPLTLPETVPISQPTSSLPIIESVPESINIEQETIITPIIQQPRIKEIKGIRGKELDINSNVMDLRI